MCICVMYVCKRYLHLVDTREGILVNTKNEQIGVCAGLFLLRFRLAGLSQRGSLCFPGCRSVCKMLWTVLKSRTKCSRVDYKMVQELYKSLCLGDTVI